MANQPGVFCLEASWANDGKDLTDVCSVEQQLRMLEGAGQTGPVIHRDVATLPEFEAYLKEWRKSKYRGYPLAYMAFHGFPGGFWPGDTEITLTDFADLIGVGKAADRIFYFGSCHTMKTSDKDLKTFCKTTGAKAIVGYTRSVSWRESAAFDCLLIPRLLEMQNMKSAYTGLTRDYADLTRILGLRMATSTWATDLKIAQRAAP
jgi:hypothetical protein